MVRVVWHFGPTPKCALINDTCNQNELAIFNNGSQILDKLFFLSPITKFERALLFPNFIFMKNNDVMTEFFELQTLYS